MQNLAGDSSCDQKIERELRLAMIPKVSVPKSSKGVPYTIVGKIGGFTFRREWSYWIVEGRVPLRVARAIHADPVGFEDVRPSGGAGQSTVTAHWLEQEAKRFQFPGDPNEGFIFIYHIDSEVGLRVFMDKLREHGLVSS